MKVFPTRNEKHITIVLLAFMLGSTIGFLSAVNGVGVKDYLPSVATLFAAFFGVSTAFLLEAERRKRECRMSQLEEGNKQLYSLYERLNAIKLFQVDFIDPVRDDPARMVSMKPMINFRAPEAKFDAVNISFLFQSECKSLMFDMHVVNELFHEAVSAIKARSKIHLEDYQPLIGEAGLEEGDELSKGDIKLLMGEMKFHMLEQTTDIVIMNVDKFIEEGGRLRERLTSCLSDLFSKDEVFAFELLNSEFKQVKHDHR
jgi:hypothetical protein